MARSAKEITRRKRNAISIKIELEIGKLDEYGINYIILSFKEFEAS